MASRVFSKLQYGKETTRGTAVAATKMILAKGIPLQPDRKPLFVESNLGVRSRAADSMIYQYLAKHSLNIEHGYYQILPMLFGIGLKGGVTATEVTPAQSDYLWDCSPSETAANAPDSVTLEMGDDTQAFETEYTMLERIRFSGQIAQDSSPSPIAIQADVFGRQNTDVTFTGSLTKPAPEFMNAKLARFYLDTAWAGVGGTEKTNILRAFDIEILTGVHPVFAGSGNKYFNAYAEGYIEAMASFTLQRGAAAQAIWALMNSQALSVARLKVIGAQIGTGTTYSMTIDIGGRWEAVVPMASEDRGDHLDTAVLRSVYDATGAKKLAVTVTTNANTI